jgi:anti-sigma factor RsiW
MSECDEVRPLLHGLFDGELDAANALRGEAHLKTCPRCQAEWAEMSAMREAIRAEPIGFATPPGLARRVHANLAKASRPRGFPPLRAWGGPAAALMAASLILMVGLQPRGPDLTGEVVSGHVRSMMASHLTDVANSSHHVVRPWFAGRLDFAPPVYDLAAQGYPLAGGRVDYLGGHPAAALVYRHGAHVINLFVWPARPQDRITPQLVASRDGYTVRHWIKGGMTCWAVSDAAPPEMDRFQALIQAQPEA